MAVEIDTAETTPIEPGRWAVEVLGLEKRYVTRKGLPAGFGRGSATWIISSLIKYRKKVEWTQAVAGVDLKVARGEIFGLLGPNGAGKTSLIKCVATLLEVDGGEVLVNGFSVRTQPELVRRSINLVGTGHWAGFDWGLTIVQNLHFFGSLYGIEKTVRQRRIDEVLERLGMTRFANSTPRTLSTGERQRMLLAKGFLVRAPVFLLDEPTVGLDPEGARSVREFIKERLVGQEGTTAILTTHRMPEAEALCHRIGIMDRGRLVACGTSEELRKLAGERSVLEVRATPIPQSAVAAVRALPGVRAALVKPLGDNSVEESLRVHCASGNGLEGHVTTALESQGVRVLAVEIEEPSLEDAFIALTDRRIDES